VSRLVNRRIRFLLAGLTIAFAGLVLRAMWLQGVRAASLSRLGETQHREEVTLPASRGTIFDRMGVRLALGVQATTVYADPRQIRNPHAVALAAGRALGLDPSTLYGKLADRSHGFVYVERQADPAQAAALAKLKLAGLGFYPEERRAYPQGSVAAQVLGYVGVDDKGLAGLEFSLDRDLAGRSGHQTIVKDPAGRAIDVLDNRPAVPGRDVTLTIDHTIQANAEEALREAVRKWGAKDATATVLDPRTGDILAMAIEPGYDANAYPSAPTVFQRNRTVTDTYEPGSTFKLVTVAGALSDHLVTPSTAFTLPYSIQVADRVIHDAEPRGTVRYSVAQILAHSSNVGAITLAEMLGRNRLSRWISRFGFGRRTGVDFPGESPGIVLPAAKWSGSTIGNVPIGQGIAVTPVQMAAAYAAVADRGVWVRPHLVSRIGGVPVPAPRRHRIVSRAVSGELMTMLEDVVAEGTGTYAAIPGYVVAGKTGTAQKPDGQGGYSLSKYVASFVGLVPATRPRLVVLVTVDEPHGAIFGGVVAAPVFQQIASFDLRYLEIPPDAPTPPASTSTASTSGAGSTATTTP
jgi:cell division protein FtsI (penicillin-binding protein 3)/stage V sporulation protein D (sporulation-specific penicillin-binding protein)